MTDVHAALAAQAELLDTLLGPPDPAPRRRWPLVVVALVVLVAAAVAAVLLVTRDDGPDGPPHPAAWAPEVEKYVAFVEKARDLEFQHPVYVDFLTDEEFTEQVTADEDDLTEDDREELEQTTGMLRALGMIEGDVDLFEKSNELRGSGVIGFYSYDDERLRIRGTEITPAVELTIVHELTHALQDQHFDLGARFEQLEESDDERSSATASGFHALVEGDARRIEAKWRDGLKPKQRRALDEARSAEAAGFEAGAKNVPPIMLTMLGAPYELGEALLDVAVQQGGERAVDDLFRSPPSTEEHQLDPWTLVADHQGYLTVPEPEQAEGTESFEDGVFGSLGWLLLLAERVPLEQALTAVDGWGGDAFTAYERDGRSCVTVAYRADTPADLAQMQAALKAWTARGPAKAAGVERKEQTLVLRSCDPGADAPRVAAGRSKDALTLALSRTYLSLELVKTGVPVEVARCGADRLVREFSTAELSDSDLDPQRVLRAVAPCRAQA